MPSAWREQGVSEDRALGQKTYLCCYAYDQKIGQFQCVVCDDAVLQCRNHRDCCVEGVAEEKISCRRALVSSTMREIFTTVRDFTYQIQQTLLEFPHLPSGMV
jgi:hypothetical protein